MAIKIKSKGNNEPEGPDEEGQPGVPPGSAPGSGLDGFERVSFMTAAWIENNRNLFFGMIIVTFIAVLGVVMGIYYVRGQQVEASDRLSEGIAAYEVLVEGSPELQQLRDAENVAEPPRIFETTEEKWLTVHGSAEATLADFDRGPIAVSARLVRAAAALNLEDFEESAQLYKEVIDSGDASEEFAAYANMGLANSLVGQGDLDGAKNAWETFAKLRPERESYAYFEMARMLERHGEVEEARDRYEQFVEEFPDSQYRDEAERRQALL